VRAFVLELPLRREWSGLQAVRAAVDACLGAAIDDGDTRRALAMVAGELIDAAVAHAAWSEDALAARPYRVRLASEGDEVTVSVESPSRPGDPAVERLVEEVRRLAESDSPEQAYVDRLRLLAAGVDRAEAVLLARVLYEGGCELSAELATDGLLRVKAVRRAAGR
jgi:hypothetical protein